MASGTTTALRRGWTTGACAAAARAREVALATLSGRTAVEVAIVDREGDLLTRASG